MWNRQSSTRHAPARRALWLLGAAFCLLSAAAAPRLAHAQGSDMIPSLGTSDKPQSKLWYNDGFWWAAVNNLQKLSIYQLSGGAWAPKLDLQSAVVPYLKGGTCDALWDGTHLFVAAYDSIKTRIYKLSYDNAAKSYALLPGFPVLLPMRLGSETIVIDEDSTHRLWATYEGETSIWVTWTTTPDHKTWSAPLAIGAGVNPDDISTVLAFGGDRIGVAWSDQGSQRLCFRVHRDADPPNLWQPLEVLRSGFGCIDDHINAKADSLGRVFLVAKDYYNGIYLGRRNADGSWTVASGASGLDCGTRPIVQVAPADHKVYVFYTRWETCVSAGTHAIEERVADLDNLLFSLPAIVIQRPNIAMNDVSGCKQPLPAGCMAVLCAGGAAAYWAGWGPLSGIGGSDPGSALPPPPGAPSTLAAEIVTEQPVASRLLLRFDEGSGTVASDASGSSNKGQLTGVLSATPRWVPGVMGSALYFDGNGYVKVSGSSLAFVNQSFTLEAWMQLDPTSSKGGTGAIFARGDSLRGNYFLEVTGQTLQFRWAYNDTTTASIKANGSFPDLAWHHVAAVWDSALSQARLYIDGHQAAAKTSLFPPTLDNGWALTIGAIRKNGTLGSSFRGNLDLVRIASGAAYSADFTPPILYPATPARYPRLRWTAVTSTAGIRSYAFLRGTNGRSPVAVGTTSGPMLWYADLGAPDGILAYSVRAVDGLGQNGVEGTAHLVWETQPPRTPAAPLDLASSQPKVTVDGPAFFELDEGHGSTAADGTGLEHDLLLGDTPPGDAAEPTWVPGITGTALEFDGKKQYALVPDRSDLRFAGSFTLETWVRRAKLGAAQALVTKDAGQSKRNYGLLVLANGNLEFSWSKSGGTKLVKMVSSAGITDMQWHHVACVHDAAKATNSIFLDGAPAGAATSSGSPYVGPEPILLGARGSGLPPSGDWLQGDIDLVRLTSRVLYTAPFTPPNLYRGGARRHALRIAWGAPPSGLVVGYRLYRGVPGGSTPALVASTSELVLSVLDPGPTSGTYLYTVTALNAAGMESPLSAALSVTVSLPTDAQDGNVPRARGPELHVFPNPFNPQATVSFRLERSGPVDLELYDVRGRRLDTLARGILPAGDHRVPLVRAEAGWRPASGVYFVRLRAEGRDTHLKVVLVQ